MSSFLSRARAVISRQQPLLPSSPSLSRPDPLAGKARRWRSTAPRPLVKELQRRGLAENITGPQGQLDALVESRKIALYAGIDPTASSLHVGHLLPLMSLLHFYLAGHHAITVIGKGTASVGDPSGRSTERDELAAERLQSSFDNLWAQVGRFFETATEYAIARGRARSDVGTWELAANSEWLGSMGLLEFLGNVGRHMRVGQMLARESVKARLASAQGINFAEFSYQLLQSYDFWHLHREKGCRLQVGGNDQYGNITAGIDLIVRLSKTTGTQPQDDFEPAYGLTVPLLTTPSGEKLGKSAGNAVWLSEKLTGVYDLYQYFVRLPDAIVGQYLNMFTLLPREQITNVLDAHVRAPEARGAQYLLAKEVVTMIHGPQKAAGAEIQARVLFDPESSKFSADDIAKAFQGDEKLVTLPRGAVEGELLVKAMKQAGIVQTRNEASNLIKSGGVYVGPSSIRVTDIMESVRPEWIVDGKILLVRVGKGKFTAIMCT